MSANAMDNVAENLQRYAEKKKAEADARMTDVSNEAGIRDFEARLQNTVDDLRQHVENQRAELEKLRASSGSTFSPIPCSDPQARLQQISTITLAYNNQAKSAPTLPYTDSLIPSLLAARKIQTTISTAQDQIATATDSRDDVIRQIARQDAYLADSQALEQALQTRIKKLRLEVAEEERIDPQTRLIQQVQKAGQKKAGLQSELQRTRTTLEEFINTYLAAMLAGEELGGAVAGEGDLPAEDDTATGDDEDNAANTKRQRRIDEIWGPAAGSAVTDRNTVGSKGQKPEVRAASREMRQLMQRLSREAEGDASYVSLDRDSAAARFLVRAKVAQFHPKNARRLRLVDFSRGWDD